MGTVLERYRVPANAQRLESPRGMTLQWNVTPQIILQVGSGHGDLQLAQLMTESLARAMSGQRDVVCFFDGMEFTGYDSDFRIEMANGTRKLMDAGQFQMLHVLTQSKLVAMGIAVVNLAVKSNFVVHSDQTEFDRILTRLGGGATLKHPPR